MCGISGYIDTKNGVNKTVLRKMTEIIKHRGPDDEGYSLVGTTVAHYGGNDSVKELRLPNICDAEEKGFFLGLGHRRLSILDVSASAHQPMMYECEKNRYIIVYNGEIYNYKEIRQELEQCGYKFETSSDTEVVLASYDKWGNSCVTRFNGMWGLAIWDFKNNRLFCSRDRLGAKPFYYYHENEKIVFGSELKQFIQDSEIDRSLDMQFLSAYMYYRISDYNERTMLEKVKALLPGHNLIIQISDDFKRIESVRNEKYWELQCQYDDSVSFEDWIDRIRNEFSRSVSWRLRSDVPVAALLSGGLDSSCMVAEISEHLKNNTLSTFTTSYPDSSEVEEWKFADMVNRHVGAEGIRYTPNPVADGLTKSVEELVWHLEMPTDLSLLGVKSVIHEAHNRGFKVILNGQCGDESWLGYERYYAFYFSNLIKQGLRGGKEALREFKLASEHSVLTKRKLLEYYLYFGFPIVRKARARCRADMLCGEELKKSIRMDEISQFLFPKNIEELQYQELTGIQLTHICHYDDRLYMSESVESRIPYMDYKMVELACMVPPKYKIKDGYTKYIIRKAYEPKLPQEVIWRMNKMGFESPTKKWMSAFPSDYMRTAISEAKTKALFKINDLMKMYENNPTSSEVFNWLQVELFCRQFC